MPEQLLGRIIRASSREGDTVLDPFGGSGTTLAVAKKMGRRFLGVELSEAYAARIEERLTAIQPGDPLDGAAEPLKSVPATKDGRKLDRKLDRTKGTRQKKSARRVQQ
jgi:site-specific DNA-methyltransferase (adenine-specific)